jgi:diacylglycerol kinase family enzyme
VALFQTGGPGEAERRAAEWVGAGETGPVIVIGGDGTVHEVVNGLLRAPLPPPLAVIPAGTGNDVARNAGLSLLAGAAVAALTGAAPKRMDAGRLRFREPSGGERGVFYLNSASVGVSARANRYAGTLRRFFPGRLCYPAAGVAALVFAPRHRLRVSAGGAVVYEGTPLNITMANGASFGGGMRISPGSSVWDGQLDRVIIGELGLVRALLALSRLYRGSHVRMREVEVSPAPPVTLIESPGEVIEVEADGHDFLAEGPVEVGIVAGALTLLV